MVPNLFLPADSRLLHFTKERRMRDDHLTNFTNKHRRKKSENSHTPKDMILKPMTSWHTALEQTILYLRQYYFSSRAHIWYTRVHPNTVVHPLKIRVHSGVYDKHG